MPSSTMLSVRVHLKQISHSKILMGTRIPISNNHQHIHWCYQGKKKRGGDFSQVFPYIFKQNKALQISAKIRGRENKKKEKNKKIKKKPLVLISGNLLVNMFQWQRSPSTSSILQPLGKTHFCFKIAKE